MLFFRLTILFYFFSINIFAKAESITAAYFARPTNLKENGNHEFLIPSVGYFNANKKNISSPNVEKSEWYVNDKLTEQSMHYGKEVFRYNFQEIREEYKIKHVITYKDGITSSFERVVAFRPTINIIFDDNDWNAPAKVIFELRNVRSPTNIKWFINKKLLNNQRESNGTIILSNVGEYILSVSFRNELGQIEKLDHRFFINKFKNIEIDSYCSSKGSYIVNCIPNIKKWNDKHKLVYKWNVDEKEIISPQLEYQFSSSKPAIIKYSAYYKEKKVSEGQKIVAPEEFDSFENPFINIKQRSHFFYDLEYAFYKKTNYSFDDSEIVFSKSDLLNFNIYNVKEEAYSTIWFINNELVSRNNEYQQKFDKAGTYKIQAIIRYGDNRTRKIEKYFIVKEPPKVDVIRSVDTQRNSTRLVYNITGDENEFPNVLWFEWFVFYNQTNYKEIIFNQKGRGINLKVDYSGEYEIVLLVKTHEKVYKLYSEIFHAPESDFSFSKLRIANSSVYNNDDLYPIFDLLKPLYLFDKVFLDFRANVGKKIANENSKVKYELKTKSKLNYEFDSEKGSLNIFYDKPLNETKHDFKIYAIYEDKKIERNIVIETRPILKTINFEAKPGEAFFILPSSIKYMPDIRIEFDNKDITKNKKGTFDVYNDGDSYQLKLRDSSIKKFKIIKPFQHELATNIKKNHRSCVVLELPSDRYVHCNIDDCFYNLNFK